MPARRAQNYDCPVHDILDRIGDAWSLLVMMELGKAPCRFNALSRVVNGISPRMLTVTLRHLERDGFVQLLGGGHEQAGAYAMTPLGRSLLSSLSPMLAWAESSQPAVRAARADYDDKGEAA